MSDHLHNENISNFPLPVESEGQLLCCVCHTNKPDEGLTRCLTGATLSEMIATPPAEAVYDPVTHTVLRYDVNDLFKPGRLGDAARKRKADGCNSYYHQTCYKRRKEAGKDNRWTTTKSSGDAGPREYVAKDLRHHCCAPCLEASLGNTDTLYFGERSGRCQAFI